MVNTQRMLGVNVTPSERSTLEMLADHMEAVGRQLPDDCVILDQGNNEVTVRSMIFSEAWDLKQIARFGTPSFGL